MTYSALVGNHMDVETKCTGHKPLRHLLLMLKPVLQDLKVNSLTTRDGKICVFNEA